MLTLHPQHAPSTALDNKSGSTAAGNTIDLWQTNNSSAQSWIFSSQNVSPAGYFTIAASPGGNCLTATGGTNGTLAKLYPCNGSAAQTWRTEAVNGGYHLSPSSNPGLCLDVQSAGTTNGTPLLIWSCNTSQNQTWIIN